MPTTWSSSSARCQQMSLTRGLCSEWHSCSTASRILGCLSWSSMRVTPRQPCMKCFWLEKWGNGWFALLSMLLSDLIWTLNFSKQSLTMKIYCLFIFRRLFSQIVQQIVVTCRLEFTNDNKIDLIRSYLILGWMLSQILLGLRNSKQESCSDKYEQFLGWSQGEPITWIVHSSSPVS